MGARYDNIAGVQHKVSKRYENINGVSRPVSKRYDNIAGVWRQGYTSAIEWTYSITTRGSVNSYSVPADKTTVASFSTGDSASDRNTETTFTFKSPIKFPATAAFRIFANTTLGAATFYVYFNGDLVFSAGSAYGGGVNLPSDTDVTTIMIRVQSYTKSNVQAYTSLTLNPIGSPSFLLNNAGYANT